MPRSMYHIVNLVKSFLVYHKGPPRILVFSIYPYLMFHESSDQNTASYAEHNIPNMCSKEINTVLQILDNKKSNYNLTGFKQNLKSNTSSFLLPKVALTSLRYTFKTNLLLVKIGLNHWVFKLAFV